MKCKKHNIPLIPKELERGKTTEVCPECEKERTKMWENAFPGTRSLEDRSQKKASMGLDENVKAL